MRSRQDRQADAMDAVFGALDDVLRRQADAVVDDVHARVERARRDLLGAVGMAVEPRLADQQFQPLAELDRHPLDFAAQRSRSPASLAGARATPVGARYSPNSAAQRRAPFARRRAGLRRLDRAGMMLAPLLAAARNASSARSTRAASRAARQAFRRAICSASTSGEGTMDRAVARRQRRGFAGR